ncbi:MAG TPA: PAS domain S-box protein [Vicinamibacterales bacterium]
MPASESLYAGATARDDNRRLFPIELSATGRVSWIALVAVAYFLAARFGLAFVMEPEGIAPIWMPEGIFLSAILLTRREVRPHVVAALCLTDFAAELLAGTPLRVSGLYALVLTGDALLSFWLIVRIAKSPITFGRTRDVVWFLALAVIVSNGLTALAAAAASEFIPGASFWLSWRLWATSDAIGNILVTPLLVVWASPRPGRAATWNATRTIEAAALFAALASLNFLAFGYLSGSGLFFLLLPYSTFPFLIWAALRFGMRGVTAALAILAAIVIPFAAADRLPTFYYFGTLVSDVIIVQLFLAIMAIPALFLGASVAERKEATESLDEQHARLNKAEEISLVGSWELDLSTNRLIWSDEVYRIFGFAPRSVEVTYEMFLEAVHPEDRAGVDAAYAGSLRDRRDEYEVEHRVVRRATGEVRHVLERCRHLRDASGRAVRSVGMVHDITENRRVEQTLRESESRFRAIFEDSPIAIWEEDLSTVKARFDELRRSGVTDFRAHLDRNPDEASRLTASARVLDINQAAARVLGFENKDAAIRDIPRHVTAESLQAFKNGLIALAEGRTHFHDEVPLLTADGTTAVFDVTFAVQRGHEDTLSRALVSFVDITERRRAEAAVRERDKYIEAILECSPIGFAVNTIHDGRIVFVGGKFEDIYGVRRGSVHSVEEFFEEVYPDPTFREAMRARIAADMASGDTARMRWEEIPITTADGDKRFVTAINIPVPGQNLMVSTVQDVTARHRAEAALRESEERFRTLIEQAGDAFELLDAEGRYLDANTAACRQLGCSREELLRSTVFDTDPLLTREHYATTFQALMGKPAVTFESTHRRFDGTTFPVEVCTSVTRLGDDLRAVTLVRDITERKRAEQEKEKLLGQLMQSQKMESVGRLAGGVAHDFNNMLSVILGNAELAISDPAVNPPVRECLQQIQAAAVRSADLTRQLLAFARKQTIAPKVLDLNDAVTGMLKMLKRLIGEDIDLAWKPRADLWPVKLDPAQIDQILANLCVNARDAIAGVGRVTIETGKAGFDESYCATHAGSLPGQFVMLAVSDDGCGMSQEVLDHLFEPFFTTKDFGHGTGLGLATVYGIVKQNDGFINVYSEPGQGTTFKIYLPRFQAEEVEEVVAPEDRAPRRGTETVLLVEDEGMILKLGATILGTLGYSVLAARTPSEALSISAGHEGPIHLLITDVVMPEMNGRELRDRILAERPETRTLFMSGYTANTIAHHGVLEDGILFLQKPFSIRSLAGKAREALDR